MEYQIISRKGKSQLVLMDMILWVEISMGINHEDENKEFECQCPVCLDEEDYKKSKLYIKKDYSVGHCFKCDRVFIHASDDLDLDIKSTPSFGTKNDDLNRYLNNTIVKLDAPPNWTLEVYNNDFSSEGAEIIRGVCDKRRNPLIEKIYKGLGFKFNNGNVAIPFIIDNELTYFQIYFPNPLGKLKYFSPPIKDKPPYILMRNPKRFILVEGVFDAIACLFLYKDITPVALIGSTITPYQISILRRYRPTEIKIYMDNLELSNKLLSKIQSVIDYCDYEVIPSYDEDPEEYLIKNNLDYILNEFSKN